MFVKFSVAFIVTLTVLQYSLSQEVDGPAILTDGNGIRIKSLGDIVFETSAGGNVRAVDENGRPTTMTGLKGEPGQQGQKGETGGRGAAGQGGNKGAKGADGSTGPPGPQGSPGSPGLVGPAGRAGSKGARGSKGDNGAKGSMGLTGGQGDPGLKGDRGAQGVCTGDGGTCDDPKLSWNQCVFDNLNSQKDYGFLAGCNISKVRNDTLLRITWDGNMRITRCSICCMRWLFFINGMECTDPAPIDNVLYQSSNYHILRHGHFTGICRQAGERELTAGLNRVQLMLQDCPGFDGFVYDAYTGWNTISRIIIEEVVPSYIDTTPVTKPPIAPQVYNPYYCQFAYPNLSRNRERNLGHIANISFVKKADDTALRFTWEGNFRKQRCSTCCTQWYITIDGTRCTAHEDVRTTISAARSFNLFFPTTLSGVCFEAGGGPIGKGNVLLKLEVGNCDGSPIADGASGFNQSSRFIVEEIPIGGLTPTNPDPNVFYPHYSHCAFDAINDGTDLGRINDTGCEIRKRSAATNLKITFNSNMRITECSDCCMRWFITIDGEECTSPGPIEGVIYTKNGSNINIHRASVIAGICSETSSGAIADGVHQLHVEVGLCDGFIDSYNAYTGFATTSHMTIEEIPTTFNAAARNFWPNVKQCQMNIPDNLQNQTGNPLMSCTLNKKKPETVIKASWYGNIALEQCEDCCMRWYLTINGEECQTPEPIDGAIMQDLRGSRLLDIFDIRRPAAISGICYGPSEGSQWGPGDLKVDLIVDVCPGTNSTFDVITGYNSKSTFIIEEIPPPADDCDEAII